MKRATLIKILKQFAEPESKEIKDFILRFEVASPRNKNGKKKKVYKIPKKFNKETYQTYLETPLWRGIRRRVIADRGRYCEACGSRRKIQVHHSIYERYILEGKSTVGLVVVCEPCHKKIHAITGTTLLLATRMILQSGKKHSDEPLKDELDILKKMTKGINKHG